MPHLPQPGSAFFNGAVDLSDLKKRAAAKGLPTGAQTDEVGTDEPNLYDSEVKLIADINHRMDIKRRRGAIDRDAWKKEYEERLLEIGIVGRIDWTFEVDDHGNDISGGVAEPVVNILRRTEKQVFDHERMAHEVVNDVMGIGEGGTIKVDKEMARALESGEYKGTGKKHHHH